MPRLSKVGAAALAAFGWTSGSTVSATYLVVAGGGSGGSGDGGGGGAGGYRTGTASLNPTLSYTVTVGAGGASATSAVGNNGSDSVFSTITSTGEEVELLIFAALVDKVDQEDQVEEVEVIIQLLIQQEEQEIHLQ